MGRFSLSLDDHKFTFIRVYLPTLNTTHKMLGSLRAHNAYNDVFVIIRDDY